MTTTKREIEVAIEVFVHGYSTDKSRTFPYEASRVGSLWLIRDAARKNPRDYRNEEWGVHDAAVPPHGLRAHRHTTDIPTEEANREMKKRGYGADS
ncbi:hypothetical protein [Mesorhizobium loti]|uniref:hypothetical protein n=1 Tax=Rhizobium loti TaxID=381 RepID=UPI00040CA7DE|nr:hypothetical protein [Mesorhizobium loti]